MIPTGSVALKTRTVRDVSVMTEKTGTRALPAIAFAASWLDALRTRGDSRVEGFGGWDC